MFTPARIDRTSAPAGQSEGVVNVTLDVCVASSSFAKSGERMEYIPVAARSEVMSHRPSPEVLQFSIGKVPLSKDV